MKVFRGKGAGLCNLLSNVSENNVYTYSIYNGVYKMRSNDIHMYMYYKYT